MVATPTDGPGALEPPDMNLLSGEEVSLSYDGREEPAATEPFAEVLTRHEAQLLACEGVVGIGVDRTRGIVVYVRGEEDVQRVPRDLEGVPVTVVVSGAISVQTVPGKG